MNLLKIINKYIFPVIIFILLLAFFIWAVTLNNKEGFSNNCECPTGSVLRNGGCYTCDNGYKLSDNYYNTYCISENPNDLHTPRYIKSAKIEKTNC